MLTLHEVTHIMSRHVLYCCRASDCLTYNQSKMLDTSIPGCSAIGTDNREGAVVPLVPNHEQCHCHGHGDCSEGAFVASYQGLEPLKITQQLHSATRNSALDMTENYEKIIPDHHLFCLNNN